MEYYIFIILLSFIILLYLITLIKNSYIINLSHGLLIFILTSVLSLNTIYSKDISYYNITRLSNETTLYTYKYREIIIPQEITILLLFLGIFSIFKGVAIVMENKEKIEKNKEDEA